MANIQNLFNGVGKLYQVKPNGAIDTFDNTEATARGILVEAAKSRIIYEAQAVDTFDFTDPNYGSTFWFNDSVSAPVHDITGADEVTDYFIVDTRNDAQQGDIVAGSYTVIRRSRITIIPLVPETGTSDDLIALAGDLLVGDLVILLPKGGGSEYTITIKDKEADGVTGGNFKLHNDQDIVLTGTNDVCLFIKNSDSIKEIARPDSQLLSVANKTLTSPGGTYYTLDPSGGAAQIKSKRGLVVLHGGTTLASGWEVWGENGGDTSISQGTTLDIVLDSPLVTDTYGGISLTIFGIQIPDTYCEDYNFMVRAWYDASDADPVNWHWEARMFADQLKGGRIAMFGDGTESGESQPYCIINTAVLSNITSTSSAEKVISHAEGTEGMVTLCGYGVLAVSVPELTNETLGYGIRKLWKPNETSSTNFICPVSRGADCIGYVMIQIYESVDMFVPPGVNLIAGDSIYFSNCVYPAFF